MNDFCFPVHGRKLFLGLGRPTFCLPVQRKQAAVLGTLTCLFRSISPKELPNKENTLSMVTEKHSCMLPILELFLGINIFVHPHIVLCLDIVLPGRNQGKCHIPNPQRARAKPWIIKSVFLCAVIRSVWFIHTAFESWTNGKMLVCGGARSTFTSWLGWTVLISL